MITDPNHSVTVRASTLRDWQRRSLVAKGYNIEVHHAAAQAWRYWPNCQDRLTILRAYRYPDYGQGGEHVER